MVMALGPAAGAAQQGVVAQGQAAVVAEPWCGTELLLVLLPGQAARLVLAA